MATERAGARRHQPERRTRTPPNQTLGDDPTPALDGHTRGVKRGRGSRTSQELRATSPKASKAPRRPQGEEERQLRCPQSKAEGGDPGSPPSPPPARGQGGLAALVQPGAGGSLPTCHPTPSTNRTRRTSLGRPENPGFYCTVGSRLGRSQWGPAGDLLKATHLQKSDTKRKPPGDLAGATSSWPVTPRTVFCSSRLSGPGRHAGRFARGRLPLHKWQLARRRPDARMETRTRLASRGAAHPSALINPVQPEPVPSTAPPAPRRGPPPGQCRAFGTQCLVAGWCLRAPSGFCSARALHSSGGGIPPLLLPACHAVAGPHPRHRPPRGRASQPHPARREGPGELGRPPLSEPRPGRRHCLFLLPGGIVFSPPSQLSRPAFRVGSPSGSF